MTVNDKGRTMKRSTANRLLDGVRERIILTNRNEDFACRVERAVVFGSYVNEPDRDRIGDLDIAIRLVDRYSKGEMDIIRQRKIREAPGHMDTIYAMSWYREEVYRFIRNRSPYIQILDMDLDAEAVFSKDWIDLPVDPDERE